MEDITEVKDIVQIILRTDEIERDGSNGSNISIPIYDISSEEFLEFAENAISSETKEGMVNTISNLKRALDCEMDMFKGFTVTNLKYMRQFYLMFPNGHALRDELSWTHYRLLIKVENDNA